MDHARIVDLVVSLNISITYGYATDRTTLVHKYCMSPLALRARSLTTMMIRLHVPFLLTKRAKRAVIHPY